MVDLMLLKCICCFPFYMQPNVSTEAKKISIYLNMVGKKINWIVIYLKLYIIIIIIIILWDIAEKLFASGLGQGMEYRTVEWKLMGTLILRTHEWEELSTHFSVRCTLHYSFYNKSTAAYKQAWLASSKIHSYVWFVVL